LLSSRMNKPQTLLAQQSPQTLADSSIISPQWIAKLKKNDPRRMNDESR
jgi:hypothetical protein